MTDYRSKDGPIQTTLRRISASKIKVRIRFLGSLNSGIPKLVRAAVQVSTITGN